MRRLSFFVLLGPALAALTFMVLMFRELAKESPWGLLESVVSIFLVFYLLGVVPMLALAGADELMARKSAGRLVRAVVCAAIAYGIAVVVFYFFTQFFGAQREFDRYVIAVGFFGLIPAAVCAWLSGGPKEARMRVQKLPPNEMNMV